MSPVTCSLVVTGDLHHRTSDTLLPKLASPRDAEHVYKKSRYEKNMSTELGETSIESAVEKSKRYLKTYRQRNNDATVNAS